MSPAVKRAKPFVPTEAMVLRGVLAYLHSDPRVLVWRSNSGAAMLPGKGGKPQPVRFGVRGQADITGLVRASGRRLEIEVKRPGGKQTPEQADFERLVADAGGLYLLVRSIEELQTALGEALGPRYPR